jgi:hypothetical protein
LTRRRICLRAGAAGRKRFFLKKEAKTVIVLAVALVYAPAKGQKVFWFVFSKKNCVLY